MDFCIQLQVISSDHYTIKNGILADIILSISLIIWERTQITFSALAQAGACMLQIKLMDTGDDFSVTIYTVIFEGLIASYFMDGSLERIYTIS